MSDAVPQRRPRNRKQLIVAAAARQFERAGFHDVSVADIAAEVGVSASALYRHFSGKTGLLAAAVEQEVELLEQAYDGPADLSGLLDTAASALLRPDRTGSVWQRGQVFLEPDRAAELQARYRAALEPLRRAVGGEVPAWAVHSVLTTGRAFERAKVDRDRARRLMVAAATAVAELGDLAPDGAVAARPAGTAGGLQPASRREAALSAAVRLFAERGFHAVGMDDIGAAAGISGPTLYHHFPRKSAVLAHVITRCLDAMQFDLAGVLSSTRDPAEALDRALASLVRINVAQGDALAALFTEIVHVPQEERVPIRRMQQDYVDEWVVLLLACRADLSRRDAHALVRSAQTVVNTMRLRLPLDEAGQRDALLRIGRAVLGTASGSAGPRQ
ncbi:TetR/AcrR family transcriptional regulator [Nocardioides daeguensis]|uniref:TetR/AcrR family transcriptional regulator n=1 Tax=Nocardioides daeguensis TaxID=908359 RepID=A0ABP6V4H3_9ACTN|nr:TetR/AcrR family transcriptional regulator [Nocardioides daeguensis]MBV6726539.1 TetR/AcrR family transcriptional regulator [Nocardioides daeguensis]MCR1772382.1 TetR/AcrR family transcriptional regulator [Nocardioides daeguensis]